MKGIKLVYSNITVNYKIKKLEFSCLFAFIDVLFYTLSSFLAVKNMASSSYIYIKKFFFFRSVACSCEAYEKKNKKEIVCSLSLFHKCIYGLSC